MVNENLKGVVWDLTYGFDRPDFQVGWCIYQLYIKIVFQVFYINLGVHNMLLKKQLKVETFLIIVGSDIN